MDVEQNRLPQHLAELMRPTPSGTTKLLAAWDALQTETQIDILRRLEKSRYPVYLEREVRSKALESKCAYIRYLAFRGVYLDDDSPEDQKILAQLRADDDLLVRFSNDENEYGFLNNIDPQVFFELPHEARLARVRELRGSGEQIATLIEFALSHELPDRLVPESELCEILADYLTSPAFAEYYSEKYWHNSFDGFGEHVARADIAALWRLVLKGPHQIAGILLGHLPDFKVPIDVLRSIREQEPELLIYLLYRREIFLTEFRKEIFLRPAKRLDSLRMAAGSYNLDLTNAEFAQILSSPEPERLDALHDLAYASDLRLCLYAALDDILLNSADTSALDALAVVRDARERKLRRLTGPQRDDELRQLRLYKLARSAVPIVKDRTAYAPRGELEFLAQCVVPDDTWRTYMAFEDQWQRQHWRTKNLQKRLPHIYGVDEDDGCDDYDDEVEQLDQLAKRIESKLSEISSWVQQYLTAGVSNGEPEETLSEPPANVTISEQTLKEGFGLLAGHIAELRKSNARMRIILYVVMVILLLVTWRIAHLQISEPL